MDFARIGFTPIVIFNFITLVFFSVAFFYQIIYFFVGLKQGEVKLPDAKKNHRFAFMIAAHNEEVVIGQLVKSIQDQNYPSELIDIYVVADACTDETARVAREAGAFVSGQGGDREE